jgi:hypothetical protein
MPWDEKCGLDVIFIKQLQYARNSHGTGEDTYKSVAKIVVTIRNESAYPVRCHP